MISATVMKATAKQGRRNMATKPLPQKPPKAALDHLTDQVSAAIEKQLENKSAEEREEVTRGLREIANRVRARVSVEKPR
jgi:hypothetical protein